LKRVSIIVPCHDSENNLSNTFAQFESRDYTYETEIIFVENGSKDSTLKTLELFKSTKLDVIILESEKGLGNALRAGINKSTGDVIAFIPDDISFHFQELDEIEKGFNSESLYFLSKYIYPWRYSRSATRMAMGLTFMIIRKIVLRINTRDTQGTFFGSSLIVKKLFEISSEKEFLITTEIATLANRLGIEVIEIPVAVLEGNREKSTVKFIDIIKMTIGLFRLRKIRLN
jgi:glycosyltransferase involved in cell wall biosynthesis